jgi:steroid delta-isomerase
MKPLPRPEFARGISFLCYIFHRTWGINEKRGGGVPLEFKFGYIFRQIKDGTMTMNPALQRPLEDYIVYLEKLSPRMVPLLDKLAAPGMKYKNPFNDVTGADAVMRVFTKIFDVTGRPKYRVSDVAWGRDGHTAYLRWTFHYDGGRVIEGVAEVLFDANGKIMMHTDHWDAGSQVMTHISGAAWVWGLIRRKFATA